jgi:hypothetical protein
MTQSLNSTDPRAAEPAADPPPAPDIDTLIAAIDSQIPPLLTAMDWADEEIAAACHRYPGRADAIFHAFSVLTPRDIGPGMTTEFVCRGHIRELLARVAAGADLRPATAAEICLTMTHISKQVPIHGADAGLYFRMWQLAFPDHELTAQLTGRQSSYEDLHRSEIDQLEADLRHKLRDPDRQLGKIACAGRHHTKPVNCTYACH